MVSGSSSRCGGGARAPVGGDAARGAVPRGWGRGRGREVSWGKEAADGERAGDARGSRGGGGDGDGGRDVGADGAGKRFQHCGFPEKQVNVRIEMRVR